MTSECKFCKSTDLRKKGLELKPGGKNLQRWQCKKCGRVMIGDEEVVCG